MKLSKALNDAREQLGDDAYNTLVGSVTEFTVLPELLTIEAVMDDLDLQHFTLKVARRGPGSYAVVDRTGVYSRPPKKMSKAAAEARDNFAYEPLPSARTDSFKSRTRFPLEEAILIAEVEVEKIKLVNWTLEKLLKSKEEDREAEKS